MSLSPSGNPEHLKAAFWIACMEAQVWEMKEALAKNDINLVHFKKELADCVLVGLDGLRLMGFGDAMNVCFERLVQNVTKFTPDALAENPRDTAWYLAKIARIREEIGQ